MPDHHTGDDTGNLSAFMMAQLVERLNAIEHEQRKHNQSLPAVKRDGTMKSSINGDHNVQDKREDSTAGRPLVDNQPLKRKGGIHRRHVAPAATMTTTKTNAPPKSTSESTTIISVHTRKPENLFWAPAYQIAAELSPPEIEARLNICTSRTPFTSPETESVTCTFPAAGSDDQSGAVLFSTTDFTEPRRQPAVVQRQISNEIVEAQIINRTGTSSLRRQAHIRRSKRLNRLHHHVEPDSSLQTEQQDPATEHDLDEPEDVVVEYCNSSDISESKESSSSPFSLLFGGLFAKLLTTKRRKQKSAGDRRSSGSTSTNSEDESMAFDLSPAEIYQMSHEKLSLSARSLYQQVLISNLMLRIMTERGVADDSDLPLVNGASSDADSPMPLKKPHIISVKDKKKKRRPRKPRKSIIQQIDAEKKKRLQQTSSTPKLIFANASVAKFDEHAIDDGIIEERRRKREDEDENGDGKEKESNQSSSEDDDKPLGLIYQQSDSPSLTTVTVTTKEE